MKAEELSRTVHVLAAGGEIHHGGGSQEPVSQQASLSAGTNPETNAKWFNRTIPTADPMHGDGAAVERRSSQRLRADRGHHELHEHEQSVRDARGRFAREKSRRTRPHRQQHRQILARARQPRRHGLSEQDRASRLISTSFGFNTVGYGCTTCIGNSGPLHPAIEEAVVKNDLVGRVGAFRQPQFRGARSSKHQGELPHVAAARRRVRAGRPRGY